MFRTIEQRDGAGKKDKIRLVVRRHSGQRGMGTDREVM